MANLYLTEQGAVLRKTGDRLLVEKDGQVLLDVQCHKIDTVLIFGNVQFTTQAVHELFEHGIELALLTTTGKLIGQLTPIMPKNIELRMAQYKRYHEPEFVLAVSKAIVSGKLYNALKQIKLFGYYHKNIDLSAEEKSLQDKTDSVGRCASTEKLLGIEGSAAKVYFGALGKMILVDNLTFTSRKKRPATDPINALLSFGYTLLFNEINSLLDGIGFDPYIGFYHKLEYGRPSLACDLIEEFRAPVIDRFTLSLVNNRSIGPHDFYRHTASGGMYLKRDGLKVYFEKYEKFMQQEFIHPEAEEKLTFRKALRHQAHKLARAIKDGATYQPITFGK